MLSPHTKRYAPNELAVYETLDGTYYRVRAPSERPRCAVCNGMIHTEYLPEESIVPVGNTEIVLVCPSQYGTNCRELMGIGLVLI